MSNGSPGVRRARGDSVVSAAKGANAKAVKERLAAFTVVHKRYGAADDAVKKATTALEEQERTVGRADAAQDAATDKLAALLPADGLPRLNPFSAWKFASPGALKNLAHGAEAKKLQELERAVLADKRPSKASRAAAKAMGDFARKLEGAQKPLEKLRAARTAAMGTRDALGPAWEKAYAALEDGAKSAAHDKGGETLYAALFGAQKEKAKQQRAKSKKTRAAKAVAAPAGPQ